MSLVRKLPFFALLLLASMAAAAEKAIEQPMGTPKTDKRQSLDLGDELRGDAKKQESLSDIDRQIELTRKIVEEVRVSAQNLRLAQARLSAALDNNDCGIAAQLVLSVKRAEETMSKLSKNLDAQCSGVDTRGQRQIADACSEERTSISKELAGLERQRQQAIGLCPELKANAQ